MTNKLLHLLGGEKLVADYKVFAEAKKQTFLMLIVLYPEFRYLFFYRLRQKSKIAKLFLFSLRLFNSHNLYIYCTDIGEGLFIEHGFSTIISCNKIGKNCWINQQVTIGYSDEVNCPTIGSNVHIKAGAKVIGGVNIGDDVVIGAGAVVVKDIPSHSIVAGVPARIIKTRINENHEWEKITE